MEDILSDLNDIKKFDAAYNQYLATKHSRKVKIIAMSALAIGLIAAGLFMREGVDRNPHLKPRSRFVAEAVADDMEKLDDETQGHTENNEK